MTTRGFNCNYRVGVRNNEWKEDDTRWMNPLQKALYKEEQEKKKQLKSKK